MTDLSSEVAEIKRGQPIFLEDDTICDPATGEIRSLEQHRVATTAPAPNAPIVEFALYYARLGWRVFPCGRKVPLTACDKDANGNKIRGTGGFYKATTNEDQIRSWWRQFPRALIGVRAGPESGIFVIDLDGADGIANWGAVVAKNAKNSAVPQTHMHLTPGGGQHLVFKWREDRPVTNSPGQLKGLKIDVRGKGGYFIAPPSLAKNGKRYEIANPLNFFMFAKAPDWLHEMLKKEQPPAQSITALAKATIKPPTDHFAVYGAESHGTGRGYIEAALDGEYDAVARASEGRRNHQLNDSSLKLGHYVGGGLLDEKRVIDTMMKACAASGLLEDGREACLATIMSGMEAGKLQPKGIPERKQVSGHDGGQADAAVTTKPAPVAVALAMTLFDDVENYTKKDWLLKGAIAKGETSMWIAPPKKLKSALMTDIAICLASGTDWRGYRSKETCGVLYFAFERADLVKRRLAAHRRRDKLTGLPIATVGRIVNLMDPGCVGVIVATIRDAEKKLGCSVGFVVFDTFAKGIAAGGGDENQAKDLGAALANLRRVQEQVRVHIAIVHHTGKDESKGARGSNAQLGDVDVMVQIAGDAIKIATVTAANDQAEGELTKFKGELVVLGIDEDGDEITTMIISADDCGMAAGKVDVSKVKLNDPERRAMDMLYNALNDGGKDPPTVDGFPHGIKVVSVDAWQTHCRRGGMLTKSRTEDAFRMAFNRISTSLANKRRIGILDDLVWVAYD